MNLTKYFQQMNEYSQSQNNASRVVNDRRGTLFNLCSVANRGTAVIRPITDTKGVPMRPVQKLYEVYETIKVLDENGNQEFREDGTPSFYYQTTLVGLPQHYPTNMLTMEQIGILDTLRAKLEEYQDLVNSEIINPEDTATNMGVAYRSEITYFWGKLLNLRTDSKTEFDVEVRLFRHHSAKFFQHFSRQIADATSIRNDDGAWLSKYFNRTPGSDTNVLSINTQLTQGFQTQFNFIDTAPYELTEEDIAYAVDLNSVGYDVTKFDTETFVSLLERVNTNIELAKSKAAQAANVQVVSNPTQAYQGTQGVQAVPTGVPNPSLDQPQAVPAPPQGTGTPIGQVAGMPNIIPPTSL
jgi:hypothetical protein